MAVQKANGNSVGRLYLMEIVGPAGVGKSTLANALLQCENVVPAKDIELRKIEYAPVFLRNMPRLLPMLLRGAGNGRSFTWDEVKSLIYLNGWLPVFRSQAANRDGILLIDQGPVFRLATLHAFGPESLRGQPAEAWWNDMVRQWSSCLDLIVWLDAPNSVLELRNNERARWHIVKGKPTGEVNAFFDRFRKSSQRILSRLTANGGPRLLQFDTSQDSTTEIVDHILSTHHGDTGK